MCMFYFVKLNLSFCGCAMIVWLCRTGADVVVDGWQGIGLKMRASFGEF